MELPDLFKKIGVSPSDIAGIKQGPGTVGKFTSVTIAAVALVAIGVIVGGCTHNMPLVLISLLAGVVLVVLGFAGIVYITRAFPTQSLEGMTLLLDRHPEAILPYLTKGKEPEVIEGTYADALDEGKKPKSLPHPVDDDSPDAPDKPETPTDTDSEEPT